MNLGIKNKIIIIINSPEVLTCSQKDIYRKKNGITCMKLNEIQFQSLSVLKTMKNLGWSLIYRLTTPCVSSSICSNFCDNYKLLRGHIYLYSIPITS